MFDIGIIGTGRVGLPLMIVLAKEGFKVVGIEKNTNLVENIKKRIFPFKEPGFQELIKDLEFEITADESTLGKCENIIITVGTPIYPHLEINLEGISRVIQNILMYSKKGQNIILRSTVAIGTTEFVRDIIETRKNWKLGRDFYISFCPERILEGNALRELYSLPQIVGVEDDMSFKKAKDIFSRISPEVIRTTFRGAELIKLFNNTSRYVYFAVVNYFYIVSELFGEDVLELLEKANKGYPRKILYSPGFTAGPCLRKDFAMISENFPNVDILTSAWKVNEAYPVALVRGIDKREGIKGKVVAILGLTFKKDSDDMRDSLIPKFIRYILRKAPKEIKINDPNLEIGYELNTGLMILKNRPLEEILKGKIDIIVFAIPHTEYEQGYYNIIKRLPVDALVCDPWDIGKHHKTFYRVCEIL